MPTSLPRSLLAALQSVLLLLIAAPLAAQETYEGWHTSLQRGVEQARQTGKPLFVVFRCVR